MKKPKLIIITTIALVVVFLFIVLILNEQNKTSTNILQDNLYYGSLDISSIDLSTAEAKIRKATNERENLGLIINYGTENLNIPATASSFDSDLSYFNFRYNLENIKSTLANYKQKNSLNRWWRKYISRQITVIQPELEINEEHLKTLVKDSFTDITIQAIDAAFIFRDDTITISEERPGKTVDWLYFFDSINQNLSDINTDAINVRTKTAYPEIYQQDLNGEEETARQLTNKNLSLKYEDRIWNVNRETIASWLSVNKNGDKIELNFNPDRIAKYLEEIISPDVNVPPQEPRFEVKDNKVSSWQLGKDGYELNLNQSAQLIINGYTKNATNNEVELAINIIKPTEANALEIKEIIGTGSSNFAGSPSNRRHNIATGAAAVHGLIIKPGEEFSLVENLGEIDENSGYLPELVIKDNKTIPEYGGGLCQVATTIFRAALATGLPITARSNHSYRVSYYEPAGTDASVYDPWPDIRFVNDSPTNILIQSRIEGNEIFFDFWGEEDGRVATTTDPVIYNITPPQPTKIIETDELAPGEKKCTEKAHNGADAYFDYTVTYPEGATSSPLEKIKRFSSHYVPWQEVCLVGREATSTPDIISSSTTPILDIIPALQP
ncbi:VanW family protein [Patescibacteria group bacterium]|nr:VanW family protein [Patescibacteria group bacterium]